MWKTALSDYLFKTIWGVMDWKNKGIKNTKLHGDNLIFFLSPQQANMLLS